MKNLLLLLVTLLTIGVCSAMAQLDLQNLTQYQLDYIKQSAESGSAGAQESLGTLYSQGWSVAQDYALAAYWYRKAAEQGHKSAQFNLAVLYTNGRGVTKSISTAAYWYQKAAEQGVVEAQFNLALLYTNGKGVEQNYATAAYWYRKAAEQGDPLSQCNLGIFYENGWGVAQNYSTAADWYRKAAEQGQVNAQYGLGNCYYNGNGVPQDYKTAAIWFRKAAEQGYMYAQCILGTMYDNGYGVAQDEHTALYWYRKAATQNHPKALYHMGEMHYFGRAVAKDYTIAKSYFEKFLKYDNGKDEVISAVVEWHLEDIYQKEAEERAKAEAEAKRKAEAESKARAEAAARAQAALDAERRDRDARPLHYFFKDSAEAINRHADKIMDWVTDYHGFDNTMFAEPLVGYAVSDNWDATFGVNLGYFFDKNRGRVGIHSSISMMGGDDSWGFRIGPILRLNDHYDDIEWQLYAGIGPHFDSRTYLSSDVGIRLNFHKLSDDYLLSLSSLSVGCQFMMGEVVPTIGVSLWPAMIFTQSSDNYTTFAVDTMMALGDGFLMGASASWTPSTLGWYGTLLAPIDACGMTLTTGPVYSMLDGMFQMYGGCGLVDDDFGIDFGLRLVANFSYSLGFQSNFDCSFLTIGYGLEF